MTERDQPKAHDQARRTAIRTALTQGGMDPGAAERWCDAWEAEAALQGLDQGPAYWEAGKLWIDAQCRARRQPPN
jgi:hypothetical protein